MFCRDLPTSIFRGAPHCPITPQLRRGLLLFPSLFLHNKDLQIHAKGPLSLERRVPYLSQSRCSAGIDSFVTTSGSCLKAVFESTKEVPWCLSAPVATCCWPNQKSGYLDTHCCLLILPNMPDRPHRPMQKRLLHLPCGSARVGAFLPDMMI